LHFEDGANVNDGSFFSGYELSIGYLWSGIYIVWSLEEFAAMDLSTHSSSSPSRRMRKPHQVKVVDLPDEGIKCPLKSEYDCANYTLEGIRQSTLPSSRALPDADDVTVQAIPQGD
ncbi:MAG: hypothetical protein ACKPKO_60975, partial [Candidatus Fonsibacter sp.]